MLPLSAFRVTKFRSIHSDNRQSIAGSSASVFVPKIHTEPTEMVKITKKNLKEHPFSVKKAETIQFQFLRNI